MNYKNICDSCWYYSLCISWTFSGCIINKGMLFSQFGTSHHMIMLPWDNVNHVLSYLLVSADNSYGRKYLTILMLEGNIQMLLIYVMFNNETNIFFNIVWTIWTYVCVSNFISFQNCSAICIDISKTNTFLYHMNHEHTG